MSTNCRAGRPGAKVGCRDAMRLTIISAVLLVAACAKPYIPPHFEPDAEPGNHFDGALSLLENRSSLHVLWIHGMCPHSDESWAQPLVKKLAHRLGIKDPQAMLPKTIGSFVHRYELRYRSKPIILDMIVWSELIAQRRASLCFDSRKAKKGPAHEACGESASYPYDRATLNDQLKSSLMNACLADALIYVGDQGKSIRERIRPDIEKALGPAGSLADSDNAVLLVSESLGSKVMFDVLHEIMCENGDCRPSTEVRKKLLKTRQVMMFANQIPILDLSGPESHGKDLLGSGAQQGEGSSLRAFVGALQSSTNVALRKADGIDRLRVVAFSDPNDVLSYRLPEKYFPPHWNVDVVNVLPSNAWVWFGLIEHPAKAHLNYTETDEVMNRFLCGSSALKC